MRKTVRAGLALVVLGAGLAWLLTEPAKLDEGFAEGHTPDTQAGETIFIASGCASCHAAPGATGEEKLVLAGGYAFESPFGTFYAPNISPGPEGIGAWDLSGFARAVTLGVSPDGAHYYPAFPYSSYNRMRPEDVSDLFAYMQTLPQSAEASQPHDLGFPFNIRRTLGFWKLLYLDEDYHLEAEEGSELARGRYLVEALGHCAECHTPRDALGGLQKDRWMAGAPNPSGKGQIPNITPAKLDWSESELVYYFESGFTPEYDSVGGSMAAVVSNLSQLSEADRLAIARYLKALPPVE